MFPKSEDMPYTVHIFFSSHLTNIVQKNGAKVGHFQEKTGFHIILLQNHSRVFGCLTLNHCMILQFVIVCISFDSV